MADLREHIRDLAAEYALAAARLKEDARLYPTAQAAPVLAAALAYQGCADRLGIILATNPDESAEREEADRHA